MNKAKDSRVLRFILAQCMWLEKFLPHPVERKWKNYSKAMIFPNFANKTLCFVGDCFVLWLRKKRKKEKREENRREMGKVDNYGMLYDDYDDNSLDSGDEKITIDFDPTNNINTNNITNSNNSNNNNDNNANKDWIGINTDYFIEENGDIVLLAEPEGKHEWMEKFNLGFFSCSCSKSCSCFFFSHFFPFFSLPRPSRLY